MALQHPLPVSRPLALLFTQDARAFCYELRVTQRRMWDTLIAASWFVANLLRDESTGVRQGCLTFQSLARESRASRFSSSPPLVCALSRRYYSVSSTPLSCSACVAVRVSLYRARNGPQYYSEVSIYRLINSPVHRDGCTPGVSGEDGRAPR
jgi:hypothetical protein